MSEPSSTAKLCSPDIRQQRKSALQVAVWFIISLIAIDLAINILFAYPKDPTTPPSHFQAYFEYGRSTEGQLRRMSRKERAQSAPITLAGWYDPFQVKELPPNGSQSEIVTVYGASHSVNLANALARVSGTFTPRSV